jgi:RND family efflux transporter MFP subunit
MQAKPMRRQWAVAALVLFAFAIISLVILANPSPVAPRVQVDARPRVLVVEAVARDVGLPVHSQGTVESPVQSELVPEVSGRVVWVSPSLATGGTFSAGDPLLRVDAADYDAAVRRAVANQIRAEAEHVHAVQELRRRERLAGSQVVSDEQLADARRSERVTYANLEDARVGLEEAERNRDRTELRAPFAGRVREKRVDVGQFVSRGAAVATLYSIDYAEVRLPLADQDLAFLAWPGSGGVFAADQQPEVTLRGELGGVERRWRGRIVRTDGTIDPRTRMVHVIARVDDPTIPQSGDAAAPLAVGLFVQAEIAGRVERDAIVLPRVALFDEESLLVLDGDDRLLRRPVDVLRVEGDEVIVSGGLRAGERVCVTDVPLFVEGMQVVVAGEQVVKGAP